MAATDFNFVTEAQRAAYVNLAAVQTPPSVGFWRAAGRKLRHDKLAIFWLTVLILVVLFAVLGPLFSNQSPNTLHINLRNIAPNGTHWFGTDRLGRDLFTRVCYGIRVSLLVALVATAIGTVIGTIYGMVMAFFGGLVDELLMRLLEIFNSLPSLLLTMIIMAVLGNGVGTMLFALAITSWSYGARQARGLVLQLRHKDYVTAALMLDTPLWKLMARHFVPNMASILILDIGQSIPSNIFAEASLSFLGLGIQAPNTSLGILIADGQDQMLQHPIELYIPIAFLVVIVLAFNIFGDSLRDALDPRYHGGA
ncbi:ABC transporter permease [Lacticaseibacillus jixiensis]|uniref:ABC transporter permease n=1 Tax=Lacticaseibacillus jixiensis TaxID=3231926 RepID=UPI0036F37D3A